MWAVSGSLDGKATPIRKSIEEKGTYARIYADALIEYANENNLDDSDFSVCKTVLKLSEVKNKIK